MDISRGFVLSKGKKRGDDFGVLTVFGQGIG